MPAAREDRTSRGTRAKPLRVVLWALLAATLLLVLGIGAGLAAGTLQRVLVRKGLGRVLGARVSVAEVTLAGGLAIHHLYLRDPAWTGRPAAVALRELRLDYSLFPADGRYIGGAVAEGLEVTLQRPAGERSNYQFLSDFLGAPRGTMDPLATLPVSLSLRDTAFSITQPGTGGVLEGILLDATFPSLDQFAVRVHGDAVRARWWLDGPAHAHHLDAGTLDIAVDRRPEGWEIKGHARLPNLLELEARAEASQSPNAWSLRAEVAHAEARGDVLALLPPELLPVPIRFESITVRDSRVEASYADGVFSLPLLAIDASAADLTAGPPDAPYYAGPLHIRGEGGLGEASEARLEATFSGGQTAGVSFRAGPEAGWSVHTEAAGWSLEQVLDLVPGTWRGLAAEYLPTLSQADVVLDVGYTPERWAVSAQTEAALAETTAELALEATYAPGAASPGRADIRVRQDGGEVAAETVIAAHGGAAASIELAHVALDAWLAAWRPGVLPAGYGATLDGEVEVKTPAGPSEPWTLRSRLDLAKVHAAGAELPFLEGAAVSGSSTIPATFERVDGVDWALTLPSDFTVKLHKWRADLARTAVQAAVGAQGSLGWVAEWLELPELHGDVEIATPLELDANLIRLAPRLTTDSLAYGAYAVPYGQTLTVSMDDLRYLFSEAAFQGSGLRAALDDDNVFTCMHVDAGPGLDRFALREWRLLSNGQPLVDMEFLLDTEGTLEAMGSAAYAGGTFAFDITLLASGALLALPSTGSQLSDFSLNATLAYDGNLSGRGRAAAGKVLAGGVTAERVAGGLVADAAAVRLEDGTMHVLGADADIEARVGVLEEGFPIWLRIYTHGADLAQFTTEFEPPSVNLTGKATGEIELELRNGTLSDFRADLTAEEGFSMNRDLVAQALMQQYVVDMPGGKSLERMIRDVIGPQPQRAFDKARLNLDFVDGRIRGEAVLESRLLNLTVDIAMDPEALVEALRARQGNGS